MAFAKKKVDLISDRSRALNEQIAALESEIQKLDTQLQRAPTPKFRSTAIPHGATVARTHEPAPSPPPQPAQEPVFEKVNPLRDPDETATPDQPGVVASSDYAQPL